MDRREFLLGIAGGALGSTILNPNVRETLTAKSAEGKSAQGKAVCIAPHEVAAEAGIKILESGGNAFDALISAAFVESVAAPAACGIGGYAATGVAFSAQRKVVIAIDANAVAPAASTPDLFPVIEENGSSGYRFPDSRHRLGALSVAVPGVLAGLLHWQKSFGRLTRGAVMAPAIQLARTGVQLPPEHAATWIELEANSRGSSASSGNEPPGRLPMNDLADSLEAIAEEGPDIFYQGRIADAIVSHLKQLGGILTKDDLSAYRPLDVEPLRVDVRGHQVYSPPPSSGGLSALQMLALYDRLSPASPGNQSAFEAAELNIEIAKVVWEERLKLLGDPRNMAFQPQSLLDDSYLAQLAERVRFGLAQPGPGKVIAPDPLRGTVHLIAADREGNVVSWTQTHGGGFGSHVMVPGTGIILGHGMCRFEPRPGWVNSIAPGKRPLHNMCPIIAVRQGVPVFATGAAGGRTIVNNTAAVSTQRLILGKSALESVSAARLQCESAEPVTTELSLGSDVFEALKARGHQLNLVAKDSGVAHILVREDDLWTGVAEVRSDRAASKAAFAQ